MLSVPQLDDLSFDKLFERARGSISSMTSEWTDFNAHDPGITTLQTFAWLSDTLNYYMDATGPAHRLKYFKLLGIEPKISCAHCTLELKNAGDEYIVPRGTRFEASGTVFEACETKKGRDNSVTAIYRVVGDKILNITHLAGVDGGYAQVFSYDTELDPQLYIGFSNPVEGVTTFYIQVEESRERNNFPEDFELAHLKWEYFDRTWKEAKVLKDDTNGLLKSGYLSLELDGETTLMENPLYDEGFYLRATVEENGYDILPNLGKIAPCCVEAEQTNTYTQEMEYVYEGHDIPIDYCIRNDDVVTVAVEGEKGFVTWFCQVEDVNSLCTLEDGKYSWQKIIHFDEGRFGVLPEEGKKIMVIVTNAEVYPQLIAGTTLGAAKEETDFVVDDVYEMKIALVSDNGPRAVYDIWESCDDMDNASYDDKVFHFDEARGKIIFGDGINGMQPTGGATVMVVTLKTSSFEKGNVLKGQVNVSDDCVCEGMDIENLHDAMDGKRIVTLEEMENELAEKLKKVTRAVTVDDYVKIIKATPGLMIDYVNIITAKEYESKYKVKLKPNTVIAAVKPHTFEAHSDLNKHTEDIILKNLEKYRLLTTNIELASPKYVAVSVFGRINLKENNSSSRMKVRALLEKLINYDETGGFGKTIQYGKIFSALEMLDEVRGVESLNLEAGGRACEKNDSGDILIYPDGLAYLRSVDIEFI